jgi:hypothetical protein
MVTDLEDYPTLVMLFMRYDGLPMWSKFAKNWGVPLASARHKEQIQEPLPDHGGIIHPGTISILHLVSCTTN